MTLSAGQHTHTLTPLGPMSTDTGRTKINPKVLGHVPFSDIATDTLAVLQKNMKELCSVAIFSLLYSLSLLPSHSLTHTDTHTHTHRHRHRHTQTHTDTHRHTHTQTHTQTQTQTHTDTHRHRHR